MERNFDAIIIGGGIVGLSVAYFLSEFKFGKIAVFEKEPDIGAGSTALCAGGIRHQFSSKINIRMSLISSEFIKSLKEMSGIDPEFHQNGYLFTITKETNVDIFKESIKIQNELGVPTKLITPEEAKKIVPELNIEDVVAASWCPTDGFADPHSVAQGIYQLAKNNGVKIFLNKEVIEILTEGSKIKGIKTVDGEDYYSPIVVNAAGPYLKIISQMAGIEIPVEPYRRQVFVTEELPDYPDTRPMVVDYEKHFYCHPESGGVLMGMSDPEEPPSFNMNIDWDFLEQIAEAGMHRIPVFEKAGIKRGWAGLYAISPDNNALIGEWDELEGFYIVGGFSGHGFMHAPAAGKILAELITFKEVKSVPKEEFELYSPKRFKEGKLFEEKGVI